MKISIEDLRRIILEQADEEPVSMASATEKTRLSSDSVDDQIDSHLIGFETDSIVSSDELVMESLSELNLKALLLEQEEGEGDVEGEELDMVGVEPPAGSEDIEVDEPAEPAKRPAMNIDNFSQKVAQLALGYRARLDVPTVIINRAINFLEENKYGKPYIESFKKILDTQFDFNIEPKREPVTPQAGGRSPALGAFGEPEGLPATGGGGD